MSVMEITLSEMVESLTGWDELAIEKQFGAPVSELMTTKPTMGIRGLVFVQKTREGLGTVDAKKWAMELSMKGAMDFFTASEEEPFTEEPTTSEGKEPSMYETEPTS